MWLRPDASAGLLWTRSEDTGLHAPGQEGSVRSRAIPPERTLARREAGATVRCNAKLSDMNDERSIEVLASGLPFHHGPHTLRSALTSCGSAIPGAARENGVALARARPDKERKYAELEGDRCHLVVVARRRVADRVLKL